MYAFGAGFLLLWTVNKIFRLRVTTSEEMEGLNIAEHGVTTEQIGLLTEMEMHRVSADFSKRVFVEPHTEVGQIAAQYNRVLDEVNLKSKEMADAVVQANRAKSKTEEAVEELQEFNRAAVGRELQMIDLKRQINQLLADINQPPQYDLSTLDDEISASKDAETR